MSQNDLVIANQSFPSFRTDLNSALAAIQTTHSGTSLPTGAVAGQIWLDTTSATSPTLKIYDGTDSISLAIIDYTNNTVNWLDSSLSYNSTATSAGTLTLTVSSSYKQYFTGTTTHTVTLPVASTLTVGQTFEIHNNSTGSITVNSSGSNLVGTVEANVTASITCILASGTTAASWDFDVTGFTSSVPTTRGGTGLTSIGTSLQVLRVNSGATGLEFATAGGTATPFTVTGDNVSGASIRLPEDTDNGSNYVALKAADSLTANLTLTLPSADGTSGQVLQTNGSGVLSFNSVSSDFVLLASTDASSSASVSFDGYFSSTYKNYIVFSSSVFPASSSGYLRIRLRKSNADITSSNYWHSGSGSHQNTGVSSGFKYYGTNNGAFIAIQEEDGNRYTSSYAYHNKIHICDPLATNTMKSIIVENATIMKDTGSVVFQYNFNGAGFLNDATTALSGITFYMSTGNIASGNFKLYGIK
jgi:hypothetical protein